MNRSVILAVLATLAFASEASAACEVTHGSAGDVFSNGTKSHKESESHKESDCASTADTNAALAKKADSANVFTKTEVTDKLDTKADITYVDSQILIVQGEINAEKIRNDTQDKTLGEHGAQLENHKERIAATEEKNDEQDEKLANHDERINTNTTNIQVTKNRLDSFNGTGGSLETWATNTDQHLTSLERTTDKHARGLAIAMAMPDTWLSDREKFALAFNVGGFDDETAFGAAAIVRFDNRWSGNMKLGTDSGFKDIGWTVGARYGF